MKIIINGEYLDVPNVGVNTHFVNMNFSDVFADAYTTDIELPMSAKNMQLLNVWSVLSRDGEPFGAMRKCSVVSRGSSCDAQLSIDGASEGVIKATLYISAFPASLNGVVNRLVVDDVDSIVDFTKRALEVEVQRESAANFTLYQTAGNVIRPNVKLSYLLERLSAATGIELPTVESDLRIVGSRQVVCPQVTLQAYGAKWQVGSNITYRYGQHITNAVSVTDGLMVTRYNRDVNVGLKVYITPTSVSSMSQLIVQTRSEGGTWANTYTLPVGQVGTTTIHYLSPVFVEGDEWRIINGGWLGELFIVATHSRYDIKLNDYDVPLEFNSSADYEIPSWVADEISFVYYGILCNLPSFTCRELLSSLAWQRGERLDVKPWAVLFSQSLRVKDITAKMLSVNFCSDKLGRTTKVESAGGEVLASFALENDGLAESVTLHKSIFAKIVAVGSWQIAEVDFYTADGGGWKADNYSGGVVLLRRVQHPDVGTMYLQPLSWSMLDVDALTRVAEVDAITAADLSNCDVVVFEGHKFLLVEGDTDELTGITNFKAFVI